MDGRGRKTHPDGWGVESLPKRARGVRSLSRWLGGVTRDQEESRRARKGW